MPDLAPLLDEGLGDAAAARKGLGDINNPALKKALQEAADAASNLRDILNSLRGVASAVSASKESIGEVGTQTLQQAVASVGNEAGLTKLAGAAQEVTDESAKLAKTNTAALKGARKTGTSTPNQPGEIEKAGKSAYGPKSTREAIDAIVAKYFGKDATVSWPNMKEIWTNWKLRILGLAVVITCITYMAATNSCQCSVTAATIMVKDSTKFVKLDYNVGPCDNDIDVDNFNPTVGDTISILSDIPVYNNTNEVLLKNGNDHTIVQVTDGSIVIEVEGLDPDHVCRQSPLPNGSPTQCNWGTFKVHTTFENQFIGGVHRFTTAGLGLFLTVFSPFVAAIINLAGTALNAAGKAFCDIVPFICHIPVWLWAILVAVIVLSVGSAAFTLVGKK
jgi:hypothetical protein